MLYSYHVHSTYSDGTSTIPEIIAYAKKIGLHEIGISDHFFVLSPSLHAKKPYIHAPCIQDLTTYAKEVLSFSHLTSPIVKLGLEVDFFPESFSKLSSIFSKWPFDYIIGSVHITDDAIAIDSEEMCSTNPLNSTTLKKYWTLVKKMAESNQFDIVAHLDLPKKFNLSSFASCTKEIDLALQAIKKADMAIEINTSGLFCPCKEQYPSDALLQQCKKLDIPILVSSDAHRAKDLIRGFDQAFSLLKKLGFSQTVAYTKRNRFFVPIP